MTSVEAAACKCFFVEAEEPQRAVPDVAALTVAAARGVLRRHEGSACDTLRKSLGSFCTAWLAGWERWLGGDGARTFFSGARALSLQPPGGLACGVDGLEGERAALVSANLMLSVAVRADALGTAMVAAGADVTSGGAATGGAAGAAGGADAAGLVARGHERLRASATERVGKMVQVAVQLAAHAEAEGDAAAAAAALAEAAGAAARAVRCAASVFALLEPAVAAVATADAADAAIIAEPPSQAVLTSCRALAERAAAMRGALEACAAGAAGATALRRVAAGAAALYREAEVGMVVACAQASSGRRLLSRLAEGSEELEQAALARQ